MNQTKKIQQGNPWESTAIKHSHILRGFTQFMRDKRGASKTLPYDNRHLKMRVL